MDSRASTKTGVEQQTNSSASSLPHPNLEPHEFSTFDRHKPGCVEQPLPEKKQAVLQQVTNNLPQLYRRINPAFKYSSSNNPRRILTEPSERVGNNGNDNAASNLVLCVNDILHSETGSFRSFRVLELLGEGTFGQVVKVEDCETKKFRAVKVIKNKPAYHNQAMMEIKILKLLNEKYDPDDSHHILRLLDHFSFKNHLCLVFEMLSVNLYELIRQNQFRGLSCNLIRTFIKQLLASLRVLRDARVIHCDLKPENVLLVKLSSAEIKLIDFGSACLEFQTVYSYIQSRFYRSPEVLLGLPYDSSIDMWSLGCIAAELFLGLPIFPGVSQHNQLSRIISLRNMPPCYMLEKGKQTSKFFTRHEGEPSVGDLASSPEPDAKPADTTNPADASKKHFYTFKSASDWAKENNCETEVSKRYFKGNTLEEVIRVYPMRKNMTPAERDKETAARVTFLHFLEGLLRWDPHKRWSPWVASQHPFITRQDLSTWNEAAVLQEEARARANMQLQTHNLSAYQAAAKAGPFSLFTPSPNLLNAVAAMSDPPATQQPSTQPAVEVSAAPSVAQASTALPEQQPVKVDSEAEVPKQESVTAVAEPATPTGSGTTAHASTPPAVKKNAARSSTRNNVVTKQSSRSKLTASSISVPQQAGRVRSNTMNGNTVPSTPPSSVQEIQQQQWVAANAAAQSKKQQGVKVEKRYHPTGASQSHTWAHPNRRADSQSTGKLRSGTAKASHLQPPPSTGEEKRPAAEDGEPNDEPQSSPQLLATASSDDVGGASPFRRDSGSSGTSHRSSISSLRSSSSSGSASAGVEGQAVSDAVEGREEDIEEEPHHRRSVSDQTATGGESPSVRRRVRSEDNPVDTQMTITVDKEGDETEPEYSESSTISDASWDPYFQSSSESSPKSVNSRLADSETSTPSSPMSPDVQRTEEQSQQQMQKKFRNHPRPVVKQTSSGRQDWGSAALRTPESQAEQQQQQPQPPQDSWAYQAQASSRSVPHVSQLYGGSASWR